MIITPFAFMAPQSAGGDPDAEAYISAVTSAGGTLSGAEETAINTFFISLKDDGIYTKLHTLYPFLGGVANAHKINATNPGTYDLTFNGTWTHSNADGSTTTDSSGNYADTGLNPSLFSSTSNFSFGQMIINAAASNGYSGVGNSASTYIISGQAGTLDTWNGGNTPQDTGINFVDGAFVVSSRLLSSQWERNYVVASGAGTVVNSVKVNTLASYSGNLYLNDVNGATGNNLSGDYRFAYMGEGLNSTEVQNLANAVNTLNTTFGRNLW